MTTSLKRQETRAQQNASDASLGTGVAEAIFRARMAREPFRHWLFRGMLPEALCREIIRLPLPPIRVEDTHGKRDSHNEIRRFFSPENQQKYAPMRPVAEAFQNEFVVRAVERLCGITLVGSYLRIEYCQDVDGFWLEPHMDIREKRITLQIYLNTDADAGTLGTDMYDSKKQFHSRANSELGQAMAFLPREPESWHGFEKRPIAGIRRSLIVNYVTDEWRARHELSYPDQPITS